MRRETAGSHHRADATNMKDYGGPDGTRNRIKQSELDINIIIDLNTVYALHVGYLSLRYTNQRPR